MEDVTVYTALIGRHEILQPQPLARLSKARWVCFTDDPDLESDDWEVVRVDPVWAPDQVRSARRLKILGPDGGFDTALSLWIDNRVTLVAPPEDFVPGLLRDADLAAFAHSFHDTLLDEFVAVAEAGLDDTARVHEQLFHYARSPIGGDEMLASAPIWTGLLARRTVETVDVAMRRWWEHVLRYSRRDQLSLPFVLAACDVRRNVLVGDNRASDFHEWPRLSPQLGRSDRASIRQLLLAPLEQLKDATSRVATLEHDHRRDLERINGEIERAHGRARRAEARVEEVSNELAEARDVAGAQRRAAGRARRKAEQLQERLDSMIVTEDRLRAVEARLRALTQERDALQDRITTIEESRAWRTVQFLRRVR
ncbi:glycosyltransferase domain-containing protein [Curtobacterium sp. SP.BCp]|uniref:glycosyltransferase domain-containing protein n=1 Tax=Curtobacterium sp. SP.BCp TaxID=3435230 RepID=UPI003F73BF8B